MPIGSSGRRNEPLHVIPMALALVLAAFTGAALGLIWQSSGLGGNEAEEKEEDGESADTAEG